MRISQCYISPSISDFPIREHYQMGEYSDSSQPCVFFGMYRDEDFKALIQHSGLAIVRWSGQDALDFKDWNLIRFPNIHHITPFPSIARILSLNAFKCHLVREPKFDRVAKPMKLGSSVYAYCPKFAKDYHGHKMIQKLSKSFDVIIGEGKIKMDNWPKVADSVYRKCFAGLVLNGHAGGGASIIEMGLRGMKVITNVLDMPHTIGWSTIEQVEYILRAEKESAAGQVNEAMADRVLKCLDTEMKYLHTEYYDNL